MLRLILVLRNISIASLAIVIALLFLESVTRKIFGISIIIVNEIGGSGMLLFTMLSLGWVYQKGGHLRTGFLVDHFPVRARLIIEFSLCILSLALICFSGYTWLRLTISTFGTGRVFMQSRLIEWPIQAMVTLGWLGLAIAVVAHLINTWEKLWHPRQCCS